MIRQLATTFADQFLRLDRALFPRDSSDTGQVIQFSASHRHEGVTSLLLAFMLC